MNTETTQASDPAAIERDIVRQREQLAGTVDALTERLDVKSRAQEKAAELKDTATTETGKPRPELIGGGLAALAAVAALLWLRSRR